MNYFKISRAKSLAHPLIIALAACLLAGCAAPYSGPNPKTTGEMRVPLVPRPTEVGYSGEVPLNLGKLWVEVQDTRDNKDQIGQNIENENKPAIKVLAGDGDSPAVFVQKMVNKQLKDLGAPMAESRDAAERCITLKLTHFWVEEAPGYRAAVHFTAEVTASGKTAWRGSLVGDNSRFGRSLSTDNYQETITDATTHAINKLLAEPGFRAAISK
jgi:hypothetical protein